jgi:cystathionine beta-lyase/cystathionine gamma-synthase
MKKRNPKLPEPGPSTLAVHAGEVEDEVVRPVNIPIYQSNAYGFESTEEGGRAFAAKFDRYVYTRLGNPTIRALERKVAALEGAEAAVATASGMSAVSTAVLGVCGGPAHIISFSTIYGGSFRLLNEVLRPLRIETTFLRPSQQGAIEEHLRDDTRMIYFESPMNPSMELVDIEAVADIASARGLLTVFDNTFATPCCQKPLELGVDVVVHSASKYFCGHGDALGGIIAGRGEILDEIRDRALVTFGGVMSPFNAWLIIRGMQTLPMRMERHCSNAQALAEFLEGHAAVERVNYPGLDSFPQKALAEKQMNGCGGVLSFEVRGGLDAGKKLLDELRLVTLSGSLGDSKTLAIHPASMSHAGFTPETRRAAGISEGLVRVAVGLEDARDIISDFEQALASIA